MRRLHFSMLSPIPALLLALLALTGPASATVGKSALYESNPALAKVSSHLLRARQLAAEGKTAAEIGEEVRLVRFEGGLAPIQVRLEELTPTVLDAIRGSGVRVQSYSFDHALLTGWVAPDRLDELAGLPEVSTVHPEPYRTTRAGSVENQADGTMMSDEARSMFGADGTGVTVGILSDSFRDLSAGSVSGSMCARSVTGTSSQASGDLPNGAGDVVSLDDGPGGGSDEGRAIGELIFDVAPGAKFIFHTAFNSAADFAGGITELVNCGADVIVDDVGYTLQPFFQDGEIAQAAQAAVDAGVPYFSAAGNDATFGIHDPFTDFDGMESGLGFPPNGNDLHDFGVAAGEATDRFAKVVLPDNCTLLAELQWSEPFDGALGPGATSDLDLYLVSSTDLPILGGNTLDSSTTGTGCGLGVGNQSGDPIEVVTYKNTTGGPQDTYLAVEHFCGDQGVEFRIVNLSTDCDLLAPGFDFEDGGTGESTIFVDSQIFGHPAAKGAVAVAAAFYGEIDAGGTDVEPYSSLGGNLPFYFDGSGGGLGPVFGAPGPGSGPETHDGPPAPETRFKPEITAPDGTNNTFFGCSDPPGAPCVEGDGLPNFFGTSASAPHAAAVAALMRDITDNGIGPHAVRQILEQAALDLEDPGADFLSGFGHVDAVKSVGTLEDPFGSGFIDDLEFDLDGSTFTVPGFSGGLIEVRAKNTLFLENGDYSGVSGQADQIIFADGFESGDTSAWTSSSP